MGFGRCVTDVIRISKLATARTRSNFRGGLGSPDRNWTDLEATSKTSSSLARDWVSHQDSTMSQPLGLGDTLSLGGQRRASRNSAQRKAGLDERYWESLMEDQGMDAKTTGQNAGGRLRGGRSSTLQISRGSSSVDYSDTGFERNTNLALRRKAANDDGPGLQTEEEVQTAASNNWRPRAQRTSVRKSNERPGRPEVQRRERNEDLRKEIIWDQDEELSRETKQRYLEGWSPQDLGRSRPAKEEAIPRRGTAKAGQVRTSPEKANSELRSLSSGKLIERFRSQHLAYLIEPHSREEYMSEISEASREARRMAEDAEIALNGSSSEGKRGMVEHLRGHLERLLVSSIASEEWKRASQEFAKVRFQRMESDLRGRGLVAKEAEKSLASIRAEVVRYNLLCEKLEGLREDARIVKAALKDLGHGWKVLRGKEDIDSEGEWSSDQEDQEQSHHTGRRGAHTTTTHGAGRRDYDDVQEEETRPINWLIKNSMSMKHQQFCMTLRERGPSKELKERMKNTRVEAIKKQLAISRDHGRLYQQMPVFTLLPTEERATGKAKFKRLKEITVCGEGNIITHLVQWIRIAEQMNMSRKEFFAVLVDGETLAGTLKREYENWSNYEDFQNNRPETHVNNVIHWGNKIIRWMTRFIAMAGREPDMDELERKVAELRVDRTSWQTVDEGWVMFRSYYRDLPEAHREAAVQYSRWRMKMMSGDNRYGKHWIGKMQEYFEHANVERLTEDHLEIAYRKALMYARRPECSWMDRVEDDRVDDDNSESGGDNGEDFDDDHGFNGDEEYGSAGEGGDVNDGEYEYDSFGEEDISPDMTGSEVQGGAVVPAEGTEGAPDRDYQAATSIRTVDSNGTANTGEDLTFTTSVVSAVNQDGDSTTVPIGLDAMSSVTTVSRALVRRMGWVENALPPNEWVNMVTGIEDGGTSTLKSTVAIQHGLTDAEGNRVLLEATHYVVEKPNFEVLMGKASLRDWEASLSFSSSGRELLIIDGEFEVPTYGVRGAIQTVRTLGDEGARISEIWKRLGTTTSDCAYAPRTEEEKGDWPGGNSRMTKRIGEPRTDFDGSKTSLRDERNPRLRSVSNSGLRDGAAPLRAQKRRLSMLRSDEETRDPGQHRKIARARGTKTDFDGSETSLRDERNPRLRSVSDSEAKVQTDCTGARQRRAGNSRLRVLPSTIEGAGNGLLARTMIKAKEQICDYRGETVSQEDIEREDLDNTYVFSWPVGDTWRQTGARLRTAHDDRQGQEDCSSPTELECKTLHDSILHWDVYLQSARSFDVYTNHNALLNMVKGQTFNLYYREGDKQVRDFGLRTRIRNSTQRAANRCETKDCARRLAWTGRLQGQEGPIPGP